MNAALYEEFTPCDSVARRFVTLVALPIAAVLLLLLAPQTASAQFGNVTLADTPVSGSSGATPGTMLTWPHTVPDSANRLLVVTISIHRTAGVTPNVNSISFSGQALTGIVAATGNSQDNSKRTEIWVLVAPAIGPGTITVTLSAAANVVGASYSFASVDQAAPVFNAGNNAAINTPSNAAAVLAICPTAFSQSAIVDVVATEATLTCTPVAGQMNVHLELTTDPNVGDRLLGRGGDIDPPGGQFNVQQYALSAVDFWCISTLTLNPAALTGVGVESFDATAYEGTGVDTRSGGVTMTWRSGSESNNLGYRIHRERDGVRTQVTRGLIAGSTLFTADSLSSGYRYGAMDRDGRPGDLYYLEDIDVFGKSTLHGPFATWEGVGKSPLTVASPTISELDSPAAVSRAVWAGGIESASAKDPAAGAQRRLANSTALKIGVRETGWYRITPELIASSGINPSSIDPRTLRLYRGGTEMAIRVVGEGDGRLDAGDSIEFYGEAIDAQSTDTQVYWLSYGSGNGLRVKVKKTRDSSGSTAGFPSVVELKERYVYFAAVANGDKENFYGQVVTSEPADHSLTLPNVDTQGSGAVVEVALQGVTFVPHKVVVSVNGHSVGEIAYTNKNAGYASLSIPQSVLVEGANTVSLVTAADSDPLDISLVDFVRIGYAHTATADQDIAFVNLNGNDGARTISGFSSAEIRAFDVTDPNAVQELSGPIASTGTGFNVTIRPGSSASRVLVMTPQRTLAPASISVNRPSKWKAPSNEADVVIISHADFIASAGPLSELRKSQGYRVVIIDVEDLYDEFSAGVETPAAIRDFVGYARTKWRTAPKFVTLLGDGTLDPKNYLGAGDLSFVPSKLVDASSVEIASDDWLVDANGDDLPDLAVGRLPARTSYEAARIIGKIVAYETGGESNRSAMLVSDVDDISDFSTTTADIRALLPSDYIINEVSRSATTDAQARSLVQSGANGGPGIVNFVGHGSIDTWRGNLLNSADALSLRNEGRLSLYVSGNCLNGYFQDPYLESLGESLLKSYNGAVAVWASSGATGPEGQRVLLDAFYRELFSGQSVTIGEAAARAKSAAAGDVRRSWVLLGDPATRLH